MPLELGRARGREDEAGSPAPRDATGLTAPGCAGRLPPERIPDLPDRASGRIRGQVEPLRDLDDVPRQAPDQRFISIFMYAETHHICETLLRIHRRVVI